MDTDLLKNIGLSPALARTYIALMEKGESTAPSLALEIDESRTNAYKLLDRLCDLGVASKNTAGSKTRYLPLSPAALEPLVQKQVEEAHLRKRELQASMPNMMDFFFAHSLQPSIRYFQGTEGLKELYRDQLKAEQNIYYIRSLDDIKFFGKEEAHKIRNLFPIHNIKRHGLTQDIVPGNYKPEERIPIAESDKLMLLERTWITTNDYDEPVEWAAYGDKIAIISYGEEAIGMIIESPQIAKAFKQIWKLLDSTIRLRADYSDMPKHTLYTQIPIAKKLSKKLK
jgi:sugar-specific transcriptional regulator TrmB